MGLACEQKAGGGEGGLEGIEAGSSPHCEFNLSKLYNS